MRLTWLTATLFMVACVAGGDGSGSKKDKGDITADISSDGSGATDLTSQDVTPQDGAIDSGPEDVPKIEGPQPDPVKSYSGGSCPTFKAGSNTFEAGGMQRTVNLHIPKDPEGASVTFLWHGFGDSPGNFAAALGAQQMSDEAHMIVVTPTPVTAVPGMGINTWSYLDFAETETDLILFDDVLSCLDENFDINEHTVYTMGVSAGALFSTKLLLERSTHITAAALYSGGTQAAGPGVLAIPYQTPGHVMPVLVVHGGLTDQWGAGPVLVKFNEGSEDLADKLTADGHPVILCDHGMGHTVPPGGIDWGWHFLRTSYWGEGESQWIGHSGPPFPDYCTFPQ